MPEFTFEAEKLGFWRQNWKHRYFAISGDDVFYYTGEHVGVIVQCGTSSQPVLILLAAPFSSLDAAAFKSRQLSKGSFRLSPISLFRHVNEPEVFVPQNAGGMLFLVCWLVEFAVGLGLLTLARQPTACTPLFSLNR